MHVRPRVQQPLGEHRVEGGVGAVCDRFIWTRAEAVDPSPRVQSETWTYCQRVGPVCDRSIWAWAEAVGVSLSGPAGDLDLLRPRVFLPSVDDTRLHRVVPDVLHALLPFGFVSNSMVEPFALPDRAAATDGAANSFRTPAFESLHDPGEVAVTAVPRDNHRMPMGGQDCEVWDPKSGIVERCQFVGQYRGGFANENAVRSLSRHASTVRKIRRFRLANSAD